MTNDTENTRFIEDIFRADLLEQVIEWIKRNLYPEDVFDDDALREWALGSIDVDELDSDEIRSWALQNMGVTDFEEDSLHTWAAENGYTMEGE